MNKHDQSVIDNIPTRFQPVSSWTYFGYSILFAIPVIGLIALVIIALNNSGNINVRNYARSFFCVFVVLAIVIVLALVLGGGLAGIGALLTSISSAA